MPDRPEDVRGVLPDGRAIGGTDGTNGVVPVRPRPFRFGVQSRGAASRSAWVDLARRAEDLGYSSLTLPDHLDDQFGPLSGLMAAADATTRLRIGHLVLANDYRHPVVLAKELATIDLLSEGRLDIAIGAGHDAKDYLAAGLPFDAPGRRIDRLEEALDIVYGLLSSDQPFSYQGKYYSVTDLVGRPRPAQRHVPLLVGAGGPRMLRLAAERADIIGINGTISPGQVAPGVLTSALPIPKISHESWLSMSAEQVDQKVARMRAAAGERLPRIEVGVRAYLTLVEPAGSTGVEAQLAADLGVDREFVRNSPFILVGSPQHVAETLLARRERWGFSHVVIGGAEAESFAPVVEILADTA